MLERGIDLLGALGAYVPLRMSESASFVGLIWLVEIGCTFTNESTRSEAVSLLVRLGIGALCRS